MNNLILSSTSDFFLSNLWWIITIAVIIALGAFFLIDSLLAKKKKEPKVKIATKSEYLDALGGSENLIDKELKGSRIIVKLNDYSKVNEEKLKEAGVTGFIKMSDKLTLVIKDKAEDAYQVIFGNND
ncbi:MAG: hypothetical protein MJ238_04195 [Bacilli bacterium]|nr:hypothetical protein [Bacilli bacterium]